ncbi:hypothetical protein DFQ26_002192 [Actinomortierella ambigua]|nr:hypothetical protein DFQ26_002192 [Actinomortierella ambigua]
MTDPVHPRPSSPIPLLNVQAFRAPLMSPRQWRERIACFQYSAPPLSFIDQLRELCFERSTIERLVKLCILMPRLRVYALPFQEATRSALPPIAWWGQPTVLTGITLTPEGANPATDEREEDVALLRVIRRLPLIDADGPTKTLSVEMLVMFGLVQSDGEVYDLHEMCARNPDLVFYYLQDPATAELLQQAGRPIRRFCALGVLPPGLCQPWAATLPLPPLLRALHYAWFICYVAYDLGPEAEAERAQEDEGEGEGSVAPGPWRGFGEMGFTTTTEELYLEWMQRGREPRNRFVYMMPELWRLEDAVLGRLWNRARWTDWCYSMQLMVYGPEMVRLNRRIVAYMMVRSPPPPMTMVLALPGTPNVATTAMVMNLAESSGWAAEWLASRMLDRYVLAPRPWLGVLMNRQAQLPQVAVLALMELQQQPWYLVHRLLPAEEIPCRGVAFFEFADVVIDVLG